MDIALVEKSFADMARKQGSWAQPASFSACRIGCHDKADCEGRDRILACSTSDLW